MKNKKKIISALVAAVLCAQCMTFAPLTVSAMVEIPQKISTTEVIDGDKEMVSDGTTTVISLNGSYKGSYQMIFDMTVSGALKEGTASKTATDVTYITFDGGKVGPYITATSCSNGVQNFTWFTTGNNGSFALNIGEKYHMELSVDLGSMDGGVGTLVITGEDGSVQKLEGLNLRNYSSAKDSSGAGVNNMKVVNLSTEPKANIVISDMTVKSSTPEAIDVTVTQPVIGSVKDETTSVSLTKDENVIQVDPYQTSEISYKAEAILNGVPSTSHSASLKFVLDSEESAFTIDKVNNKIIIDNSLPVGTYNASITSQVIGDDETIINCPIVFEKKAALAEDIAEAFKSRINISSADPTIVWNPAEGSDNTKFNTADVYEDLSLPKAWGDYDVTWTSSNPDVVAPDGKVIPAVDDTNVTLTASIDVDGTEVTKDINVTVRGAKKEVDAALAAIVMMNSKNVQIKPESVTTDFSITAPTYNGNYIKLSFDESTGYIRVDENGNATLYPSAEGNNTADLKVTATYIKDGVEVLSDSKSYALTLTTSPKAVVDEVLAGDIIINADTQKAADLSSVSYDLILPEKISGVEFSNWKIDNDYMTISEKSSKAEISGSSIGTKTGKITADVEYKKGDEVLYSTEYEKDVTVKLSTDMADKYIVRCDMLATENFAGLPADGDVVTESKLDLPTEGVFGSSIQWTSSVPSAISKSGKVERQRTAKKVTLTATISKGSATAGKYSIGNLIVPSTTGSTSVSSGGSSGGGSSSSSNTNSTVSSTGNRNSDVSYKGSLMPTTSLEKGDITTAQVVSFSDLSSAAWAKEAVTALYNKGIINGKSDSAFAPNDDITRAEFAKIVVKAFGLEDTSANVSTFSDVKAGDWFYTAVASAYNKGIIKGYEDGSFGVSDKITRQDMAVIIYRAAQIAGKTIAPVKDGVQFTDSAEVAEYAAEAVSTLQKGGVINGMTATTFAPKATATRAQAAQMIYGIVK